MIIQLPNGLIDGQDLFNYAEIDELRGKQQNYLANRELVDGNIGHVPKILADVVKSLQTKEGLAWQGNMADAIEKLPIGDIETLLIKIRQNTYGPRFYLESKCPHCEYHNKNLRIDLDTLELDVISIEDMLKPKKVLATKSNKEVEFKPGYLKDLFNIIKFAKSKQDKLITSFLATTIKRIGDDTKNIEILVEDLPSSDIMQLNEEAMKMKLQGTIDTNISIDCAGCAKEYEAKLNTFDASFFDPSKGSTS